MTSVHLRPIKIGPAYRLTDPAGATTVVQGVHLGCFIRFPRVTSAVEGIIDTGAPFTVVPERVWRPLIAGVDFDWLATDPPGTARVLGRTFPFRFARFLVPLAVEDYVASVPRADVTVQFADGDPFPGSVGPIVLVGHWGGLLDDSTIRLSAVPPAASLEFA